MQGMWVPMAEAAINVIYNLSEHPDRICGQLVKNLIKTIFGGEENLDGGDTNSDKGKYEYSYSILKSRIIGLSYVYHQMLSIAQCIYTVARLVYVTARISNFRTQNVSTK